MLPRLPCGWAFSGRRRARRPRSSGWPAGGTPRRRDARGGAPPLRRRQRLLRAGARAVAGLLLRLLRRPPTAAVRTLEAAQRAKCDLVARKLALRAGMRVLDVGCGWGTFAIHAARTYGVRAVGVTLSVSRPRWPASGRRRRGLGDRVEIRVQDYRDVLRRSVRRDRQHRHGRARGPLRPARLRRSPVLAAGAAGAAAQPRHRPPPRTAGRARHAPRSSSATSSPTASSSRSASWWERSRSAGFEVRDVESLREHYGLTLRAWVANLEARLGRGCRPEQPRPGPGVAALHGGVRAGLRGQPPGRQPGARRAARSPRRQRDATQQEGTARGLSRRPARPSAPPSRRAAAPPLRAALRPGGAPGAGARCGRSRGAGPAARPPSRPPSAGPGSPRCPRWGSAPGPRRRR